MERQNKGGDGPQAQLRQAQSRIAELERQLAEAREKAEFLQELVDCLPDVIQWVGPDGVVRFTSRAVERDGYTVDDFHGKWIGDFYPPEDREPALRHLPELLQLPDGVRLKTPVRIYDKSNRIVTGEAHVAWNASPRFPGSLAVVRRVEDKALQMQLFHDPDESVRTIFNSVQDAIFVHDAQGNILHVNDMMSRLFGVERELSRPLNTADRYYGPIDGSQSLESTWQRVLGGAIERNEWQCRRDSDGVVFDADVFMRKIHLEGQDYVLCSVRDITPRKQVERELERALAIASKLRREAEQAGEAKSRFLANMSHELRTPLNSVIGFAELLEDQWAGTLNEKQLGQVRQIFTNGHHLLNLINDILDLAKVEAGKMDLRLSVVNPMNLLHGCMLMIKERALKRGLRLSLDAADDLDGIEIRADEVKLKQIVVNLLSNAVKFTPDGGRISLEAERDDRDLVVTVADSGIGIKPKDRKRIFDAFEQADSSLSRPYEGTGLGLALTKQLVEIHGGTISVASEGKGKGSRFSFRIPFVPAVTRRQESSEAFAQGTERVETAQVATTELRPRVLIIEDNEANMKLASNLLEAGGYAPLQAWTAEQGIRAAHSEKPDLILMDISLPFMDGLTATKKLKDDPATEGIPIIALTAHAMMGDESRVKAAGCAAYLTKPIDTDLFYGILAENIRLTPSRSTDESGM